MELNATDYGLTKATKLQKIDENTIAIVIDRKSRIIMKDGENILKKADIIQRKVPEKTICLQTTAPVCRKTTLYLQENGILVLQIS